MIYHSVLEVYPAEGGGVITLHTYNTGENDWRDGDFYTTGQPGEKVPGWFQTILNIRTLGVVQFFPFVKAKEILEKREIMFFV